MPDWALLSNDLDARDSRGLVEDGEAGSMSDHSLFVLVLPQLLTVTSSHHSTFDFGQVVYGALPLRQHQSVPSSRGWAPDPVITRRLSDAVQRDLPLCYHQNRP